MKGLSVWGFLPSLLPEFVQGGGAHLAVELATSTLPSSVRLKLGGILSPKQGMILLALAKAEPVWLTWGGATPGLQGCSPRAGLGLSGKGPHPEAIRCVSCFLPADL